GAARPREGEPAGDPAPQDRRRQPLIGLKSFPPKSGCPLSAFRAESACHFWWPKTRPRQLEAPGLAQLRSMDSDQLDRLAAGLRGRVPAEGPWPAVLRHGRGRLLAGGPRRAGARRGGVRLPGGGPGLAPLPDNGAAGAPWTGADPD